MARVGVLTTSYPHREDPVAGTFVRGMALALRDRGHTLEVLAPAPRQGAPLRDEGVETRHVRYAPRALARTFYGAGVPDNVRRDPRSWPGLATLPSRLWIEAHRRREGWDAIVSHWALPSALIAGAVRGPRPHLAVLHSADVHVMRRMPARRAWARLVGQCASELLFASNALREELLSWLAPVERADLARRCHACAMGIEPTPGSSVPRRALRERWALRGFTVLFLGRLVPIKGLARAIDAIAGTPIELVVAGDGPERAALSALASSRGARVRFVGVRTGADKAALLAACDAFIAPSLELPSGRTEGTPTAVLEAADAGLSIVASPTGGVLEVLEHERSALLVPPTPSLLRAALLRLAEDRPLRRRLARGARAVGARYRWPALAPRIEELLFGR